MTQSEANVSNSTALFDTIHDQATETYQRPFAEEASAIVLDLGELAMQFARVERVPRYDKTSRENDAEHSFMLSLVATELASQYFPDLDAGLVAQFSNVHDLVELETDDVATFTLNDAALAAKEAAEYSALDTVAARLPRFTRDLLLRYEAQVEAEARFVRLVDKILPVVVDIVGPGRKVMAEDYGIVSNEQLASNEQRLSRKLRERFPDKSLAFIHLVRDMLADTFALVFSEEDVRLWPTS